LFENLIPNVGDDPCVFETTFDMTGAIVVNGEAELSVFRCPSSGLLEVAPPVSSFPNPNGSGNTITVPLPARLVGYGTSDYKGNAGESNQGVLMKRRDGELTVDGVFECKLSEIFDGLSNTALVAESSYAGPDGRRWPIWAGGNFDDETALCKVGEIDGDGLTIKINCWETGGPSAFWEAPDNDCAWSFHPGGAMFSFVDGSTHFISENVSDQAYANLGSRLDGNPLGVLQ
jgi:prepilin-type processing-associated H-X9-DG protein